MENAAHSLVPKSRLAGLKVLVIDDSKTIRRTAETLLAKEGCEVYTAVDGFDALSKIADHQPDIVFVDIMMPRLDGYQTCSLIKHNKVFKQIPVIMLSSKDGLFDRARGRIGVPFTALVIAAVIARVVAPVDVGVVLVRVVPVGVVIGDRRGVAVGVPLMHAPAVARLVAGDIGLLGRIGGRDRRRGRAADHQGQKRTHAQRSGKHLHSIILQRSGQRPRHPSLPRKRRRARLVPSRIGISMIRRNSRPEPFDPARGLDAYLRTFGHYFGDFAASASL